MKKIRMKTVAKLLAVLNIVLLFGEFLSPYSVRAADEKLTFGTNIRLRYEFCDDFNQLYYGDNPGEGSAKDGFLLGRFRAGFDYRPCDKTHFALWMQDAEAWDLSLADSAFYKGKFGMENNGNKDRWELWDTYLEVKELFDLPLSLKGGRQRISYGNERVFGPGEWGNSGRWVWDAIKASWQIERGFVDAYYGRTMLHDHNNFSLNHRHGFESRGVYSHFELAGKNSHIVAEPFFMTQTDDHSLYKGEDQRMGDLDSYYSGLRIYGKGIKGFDYDLTFVNQAGDFSHDDIKAYGYHLLLAYNFNQINIKPRLSVEYTFASGDSNPDDGDHETFEGAFGARAKICGRMNLFYWQNIKDAQINLEVKPKKWFYLKVEFHKFRLAEREDAWYLNSKQYRDKTGASGDEVGREFDIVAAIDFFKNNQLQVGFGHFRPDEFVKKMVSDKSSNWLFLQWTHKFSTKLF